MIFSYEYEEKKLLKWLSPSNQQGHTRRSAYVNPTPPHRCFNCSQGFVRRTDQGAGKSLSEINSMTECSPGVNSLPQMKNIQHC